MANEDLGLSIICCILSGEITDPAEAQALFAAANGSPILKETPSPEERATGIGTIANVLDCNGDLLVAGRMYLYEGKKIRVQREKFGSGNILDTYYCVWYLDTEFKERFIVIDARYPKGFAGGPVYKSDFVPA